VKKIFRDIDHSPETKQKQKPTLTTVVAEARESRVWRPVSRRRLYDLSMVDRGSV